jgi:hypothetical protein
MMKRFALIVSLVAVAAATFPALTVAQATQAGDATMLNSLPPSMRLSKDEVYSMYLSAIQKGYVEKTSGDGSMIFIMTGKGMSKSREQVLKELMDQTPEQRRNANKP